VIEVEPGVITSVGGEVLMVSGMTAALADMRRVHEEWASAVGGATAGMNAALADLRRQRLDWASAAATAQGFTVGVTDALAAWRRYHEEWVSAAAKARQSNVAGALPAPEVQQPELLLPAAIIEVATNVTEGEIIAAVSLPWFDIVRAVERDPNFLYQLSWRTLEELVAGAYRQEGWPEVILTSRSGDGGRDIIASKPGWGAVCFYDQVKAYSPGHKVPANDVRAIYGVVTLHQNVSKAVITTTASFAPGVYEEFKPVMPNRLELRDGPKLREWLLRLGGSAEPRDRQRLA
jgi:restriction system protein